MYNIRVDRKIGDCIKLNNLEVKSTFLDTEGNELKNLAESHLNLDTVYEVVAVNVSVYLDDKGYEQVSILIEAIDILDTLGDYYIIDQQHTKIATEEEIINYENSALESSSYSIEAVNSQFTSGFSGDIGSPLSQQVHLTTESMDKCSVNTVDSLLDNYNDLLMIEKYVLGDNNLEDRKKQLEQEIIELSQKK